MHEVDGHCTCASTSNYITEVQVLSPSILITKKKPRGANVRAGLFPCPVSNCSKNVGEQLSCEQLSAYRVSRAFCNSTFIMCEWMSEMSPMTKLPHVPPAQMPVAEKAMECTRLVWVRRLIWQIDAGRLFPTLFSLTSLSGCQRKKLFSLY